MTAIKLDELRKLMDDLQRISNLKSQLKKRDELIGTMLRDLAHARNVQREMAEWICKTDEFQLWVLEKGWPEGKGDLAMAAAFLATQEEK